MTTGWGAPRTAYQYTAAIADGDTASADAIWQELSTRERRDLLLAIGAQTRAIAAACAPESAPRIRGLQVFELIGLLRAASPLHGPVRDYAIQALRGCGCRPPRLDCQDLDQCLRTAAAAMTRVRLDTAARFGFGPRAVAVICRRSARLTALKETGNAA